jgi:membrane-associated PAP2 superfamily phosphatase
MHPMPTNIRKFLTAHFLLPVIVLITISIFITVSDVDRIVADYFYAIQGNQWAWKDSFIAEQFFHKGGRNLSLIFALASLALLISSCFQNSLGAHTKPLLYLFLATTGGSLLISILKASFSVPCPWEFYRYGGTLDYHNLIEQLFLRNGSGCFPAGQASAGYAWVSCYFLGLHYQSKWRWAGLIIPILAGIILGFAQQIRGAHFISHDLWTLAICWIFSLSLFLSLFKSSLEKSTIRELVCL